MSRSGKHQAQLDGLRAVAIFIVMIHHFVDRPFLLSGFGVTLFFVLSGYFATRILLSLKQRVEAASMTFGSAMSQFYFRRYLRIVPPYYLTLLVALLLNIPDARSSLFWNATFLSNIQMVRNGEWNGAFSHLWSLAVLEQYYWIWPLVLLGFSRRTSFSVATTLVLAGPIFRMLCLVTHSNSMSWLMMPFSAWDQLSCGAVLALCRCMPEDSASFKAVQFIGNRIATSGFVLILTCKALHVAIPFGAIYVPTVAALCFVALIHATAKGHKGPLGRFLEWEALGIIGRASYSIFLLHGFTIFVIPRIGLLDRIVSGDLRCIVLLPGSIALGYLACRFIERPILNLRERLSLLIEAAREGKATGLGSGLAATQANRLRA